LAFCMALMMSAVAPVSPLTAAIAWTISEPAS
jgi:hypothetical protein